MKYAHTPPEPVARTMSSDGAVKMETTPSAAPPRGVKKESTGAAAAPHAASHSISHDDEGDDEEDDENDTNESEEDRKKRLKDLTDQVRETYFFFFWISDFLIDCMGNCMLNAFGWDFVPKSIFRMLCT